MSATSSSRRSAPVRRAAHAALLPASLIVSAMLAACSKPPPDAVAPRPVRAQAVVLAAGAQDDNYTGAVRARVESDLAFRVGGKVVQRKVDVGQQVRTGDVLAALDAGDYGLGVAAAVNQEKAAAVEAGQAATDAARFARLQVAGAIGQGEAERQQARADAARERLDQARRQAELARNRATYAVLRAPFDGVVTSVRFETGQVVSEGQTVMTLAAHGEREIVVDIPETRVLQARRATLATASLWVDEANAALPAVAGNAGRFAVTLRELSPVAATATRTYRARYRVGSEAPPMELGMTATVWLQSGAVSGAPRVATLPAAALHHRDGHTAVWIVDAAQRPALVPVEVVRYGQDEVQVTGLAEGQLVATAGVQKLTPGMTVVAVNAEGQPLARGATRMTATPPPPWPRPRRPLSRSRSRGQRHERCSQPVALGGHASFAGAVPGRRGPRQRRFLVPQARAARGPELPRTDDDGDRRVARRLGAGSAGPGAQPDREETAGARALRQRAHLQPPGLRCAVAVARGRHAQGGPGGGVVPGAQAHRRPARPDACGCHRPGDQ